MRGDDRFMTTLTVLVLVIAAATFIGRSGMVSRVFSDQPVPVVRDDSFVLTRDGGYVLDVLANDVGVTEEDRSSFRISAQPGCGFAIAEQGRIVLREAEGCIGRVNLGYCVVRGTACVSAEVTVTFAEPQSGGLPVLPVAERGTSHVAPNALTSAASAEVAPVSDMSVRPMQHPPILVRTALAQDMADAMPLAGDSVAPQVGARPSDSLAAPRGLVRVEPLRATPGLPAPDAAHAGEGGFDLVPAPVMEPLVPVADRAEQPVTGTGEPASPVSPGAGDVTVAAAPATLPGPAPLVEVSPGLTDVTRVRQIAGREAPRPVAQPGFLADPAPDRPALAPRAVAAVEVFSVDRTPPAEAGASDAILDKGTGVTVPAKAPAAADSGAVSPALRADPPAADALPEQIDLASRSTGPATPSALSDPEICPAGVTMAATEGEMLQIDLRSPCRPGMLVSVRHAGLTVQARLGADGRARVRLPAMAVKAKVEAAFADGVVTSAHLRVPGVEKLARVALVGPGGIDLDLHVREYAARPGSDGHVWAGHPRSYREARRSGGGWLVGLPATGTDGGDAEVYTLPIGRATREGVLSLEVQVGDATPSQTQCGQTISYRLVKSVSGRAPEVRDFRVIVPACADKSLHGMVLAGVDDLVIGRR